jgi:hypothetical protein
MKFFGGSKSEPVLRRKPNAPNSRPQSRNEQKFKPQEDEEDDQASARQDDEQEDDSEQSEEQDGQDRPQNGRSGNGAQNQRSNGKSRPQMPGSAAARKAMEHLAQLTGQTPESISGLTATGDGWKVVLDVVELERIPRTTDVMASYEVELDGAGELAGYRRLTRYYRNQVDER